MIKVSYFKSVYETTPGTIDLRRWLGGYDKLNQVISSIRSCNDPVLRRQLKLKLPCMIPAGVFNRPADDSLQTFSGLMSLDFDHISQPEEVKRLAIGHPNCWYAGLSAGGKGVFALISVADDAVGRWKEYHAALIKQFGAASKSIDVQCSNISRKRFYSYDPRPMFNHDALNRPFVLPGYKATVSGYSLQKKPVVPSYAGYRAGYHSDSSNNENQKIEQLIERIEQEQKDITSSYNHWISIGGSLANVFGEGGREYFHRISQYYPGYDARQVNRQYSRSLRNPPGFGLRIIFSIAKKNDLLLKSPDTVNEMDGEYEVLDLGDVDFSFE